METDVDDLIDIEIEESARLGSIITQSRKDETTMDTTRRYEVTRNGERIAILEAQSRTDAERYAERRYSQPYTVSAFTGEIPTDDSLHERVRRIFGKGGFGFSEATVEQTADIAADTTRVPVIIVPPNQRTASEREAQLAEAKRHAKELNERATAILKELRS